jgi:hypothetical protein
MLIRVLFKIVTDLLEQLGFTTLVCVMITIVTGVRLPFLLLTALGAFLLLGAANAVRGYAAERLGKEAAKRYFDALVNVLVSLCIYATYLFLGVRAF